MLRHGVEIKTHNNTVGRRSYHVLWCPKYRRSVTTDELKYGAVDTRIKEHIAQLCVERGGELVELETSPDHVHLLVGVNPRYGINRLVKGIKGRSSRLVRDEFSRLRRQLPTRWTNSYFVATLGRFLARNYRDVRGYSAQRLTAILRASPR